MPSRVIRPTRLREEARMVSLPPAGRNDAAAPDELGAARERERAALEKIAEYERRWNDREAGFDARLAAAAEDAARPVEEIVGRFTSMMDDFEAQRRDLVRSSEDTVVRLAVAVARRILSEAVTVDEEGVLETVRRALKQVVEKENVIIHVNPDDLRIVREHGSEWLGILEGTRSLEIQEDDRIGRGGCLVETESGNVEAQIEKQLKTLERALIEKVR
ncbi:MAG: FliH/SctL family protein [Candidatus Eisenbacteria bacterium]